MFSTAAELSPPQSPSSHWPTQRRRIQQKIISMAETIMDEVVTQLLTEAADKVLKEEE
jgi:3-oxoacyl-[acyl-carrier-protein] synthase III